MADEPVVKLTGSQPPPEWGTSRWGKIAKTSAPVIRRMEEFKGKKLAPKYEFPHVVTGRDYFPTTKPSRRGETAQQMPYYSQLTPFEKGLYEWLPGFSESTVGQALQKFGESPFGKALQVLDIGAETLERVGGVGAQFWQAKDDPVKMQDLRRDLTAAWYAGSLGADMWNLPTFDYDQDGNVLGISIPTDLPGSAGLAQARKDIIDLVDQGATYSEALQEVKGKYYDSLGALQLRAQLYDTYTHVLFDPINYVMPKLRPIERLRAAAESYNVTKWSDDVIDANRVTVAAAKTMDEVVAVANKARGGQQGTIARALRTNERLFSALDKAQAAGDVEKAREITGKILDSAGLKLNEKAALYLTGKGDPLGKPKWWDRYWPFSLTPESRAQELVTTVHNNVNSYIISRTDDPYEIANDISRAAAGAVGPEMGHAFVTREGRAVQGLLQGFEVEVKKLIGQYDFLKDERRALTQIAETLGTDEEKIIGMLENGDFASVSRMSNGLFSPDDLEALVRKVEGLPYTDRLFKYHLMNKLSEVTAHQGVLMYGVKARGFGQKLASAMKAAETLAFLRINPGYAVRNWLNNELTMIGRGLGVNMNDIDDIVKNVIGFEPYRMSQGFGAIGDALGEPADAASKIISDVTRGERGALDRFTDYVSNIKVPFGLDMGQISSRAEQSASRRAFTSGYLQGWNRYFWKPGKGFDAANTYFPAQIQDMMNTVDQGIMPAIDDLVASAKNPQQLQDLSHGNLNLSPKAIFRDASERLGYSVEDSIPDIYLAKIEGGLNEAAQNGTIREYMSGVRDDLQQYLDEISKDYTTRMRDYTIMKMEAEGPKAFPKIWADQMREWHGAAIQHTIETQIVTEAINAQKAGDVVDWELIGRMWDRYTQSSDQFYTRHWDRFDGTVQGMVKGAKSQGMALSDEIVPKFKDIKKGWQGWWKNKRKLQADWREARAAGKTPARSWDDIQDEISRAYKEMSQTELRLKREIDQQIAKSLPDPKDQQKFLNWQETDNYLQELEQREVEALWENVRNMSATDRQAAFEEFQRLRLKRYETRVAVDNAGEAAMMGDAASAQKLDQSANQVARQLDLQPQPVDYRAVSRTELPKEVSDAMEREAASLKDWLSGAGVERLPGEEPGTFIRASSNPEWYLELYRQGFTRKQVENSLERILQNKGKDIAKANETALPAIKDMIMDRLISGEEMPPHPAVLLFFNMEDEAAQAIGQYLTDPNWSKYATNEDWFNLVGGEENLDRLVTRLDEINEGLPARTPTEIGIEELEGAEALGGLPELGTQKPYIPNFDRQAKPPVPAAVMEDTYWFTRGNQALDGIERAAIEQAAKPPLKWQNLPKEAQQYVENYLQHVQGQMSDARYASTRFAEFRRDAALLNYNRRYNFDTWATMIFPYQFWFTHSAAMWMLHTVDRPAMLSTFLRIKEFMNTAGSPNQALPSRLKGTMRVPIPFLPDWMGDSIFFDPLRALLPFDTFAYPFEQYMQRNQTLDGRIEFILSDMLENGQITEEEFNSAIDNPDSPIYNKARETAIADDQELQYSVWDFANLISAPHAPLNWAYEAARGTPENIGPFTPASRTIKGVAGLLGVDWDRSPYNIEARVRTSLGLPAFDKWDDYRVDRMLSNMAAMGEITVDEAHRAMIDREGDAYNEAIKKANKEFGVAALGSTVGIPAKAYPEGEYLQRSLKDDFEKHYEAYENAIDNYFKKNPVSKSVEKVLRTMIDQGGKEESIEEIYNANKNVFINSGMEQGEILQILREISNSSRALTNFFRVNPEYENRLALFKPPEERLKNFLIDDIWNIWNDLPKLTKGELKEQLGQDFAEKFVDKWTRSYDAISLDEMQVWLKLMGGDPPGTLNSDPAPIDLTDPEIAWRVQVFYDTRQQYFGNEIFDTQSAYYDIPENNKKARKAYRNEHPELVNYWEWRRDWLHRNPETVPYLTEKPYEFEYSSPEAQRRAEQPAPWMTWDEWRQYLGPNASNLMEDHFLRDYEIPGPMQDRIEDLSNQLGISYSEALGLMEESLGLRPQGQTMSQPEYVTFEDKSKGWVTFNPDGSWTKANPPSQPSPTQPAPSTQTGPTRYNEPGEPVPWKVDDRLSSKAKDILGSNTDVLYAGRVPGVTRQAGQSTEAAAFAYQYPESIARREEGGFHRYYAAFGGVPNEETYLHELAHTIDFVEGISKKSEFAKDAARYEREEEPNWPWETNDQEWFAMLFARAVTGNQEVPKYVRKWIEPYINKK